ncbi:MAG: flagellin lysine-N-methylase [Lachnospiraceae bacterium]|nr:flagellin lysine-N-methylase [Lachnospiraceae bacterium]
MEVHEISFYKDFTCLGDKCPETCCRGWQIPLSDEDLKRFGQEKGLLKMKILLAMSEHSIPVFNENCSKCPFLTKKGLCSMQLKKGHDYLPEVCRSYPRFIRNYGFFSERYPDLSCIHAASLFTEHIGDLILENTEEEPPCERSGTNDDPVFMEYLKDMRSSMINALMNVETYEKLAEVLDKTDSYALEVQSAYLKGIDDYPATHPFIPGTEECAKKEVHPPIFPLRADELNKLMHSSVYHIRLKMTNPRLHELFMLWFGRYHRLVGSQNAWKQTYTGFMRSYPETASYFASYYAYYLYMYFFKCFEDYSFVRNIRIGMIHLSMIFAFCVLYEKKHSLFDKDSFAHIIAVYNRRAYFSDTILDEMYKVLESRSTQSFTDIPFS